MALDKNHEKPLASFEAQGHAASSLMGKAGKLRGKLLICQGAVDNTVVWEHSLSFIQEFSGQV